MRNLSLTQIIEDRNVLEGEIGLALVPDSETANQSKRIASEVVSPDAEYVLGEANLPHVTLYQAPLKDFPRNVSELYARELISLLRGQSFLLRQIAPFGGGFLYWNIDLSSEVEGLRAAHEMALELHQFLNTELNMRLQKNRAGHPRLLDNWRKYGYGLVGDLYQPHITLGYESALDTLGTFPLQEEWNMRVSSVAVTRIGQYGQVIEEIFRTE